jgi:hypothetical protein
MDKGGNSTGPQSRIRFSRSFSPKWCEQINDDLKNVLFCEGCAEQLKYDYLMILYQVVDESTVCLMGHERRQTLQLIEDLRQAGPRQ